MVSVAMPLRFDQRLIVAAGVVPGTGLSWPFDAQLRTARTLGGLGPPTELFDGHDNDAIGS